MDTEDEIPQNKKNETSLESENFQSSTNTKTPAEIIKDMVLSRYSGERLNQKRRGIR